LKNLITFTPKLSNMFGAQQTAQPFGWAR